MQIKHNVKEGTAEVFGTQDKADSILGVIKPVKDKNFSVFIPSGRPMTKKEVHTTLVAVHSASARLDAETNEEGHRIASVELKDGALIEKTTNESLGSIVDGEFKASGIALNHNQMKDIYRVM
jgi:hypothetical protein